jgi:pyridoxine kinase
MYEALEKNELATYSHMLTGYMMNENVLRGIMTIYAAAKKRNPGLKYVCDPVMADDGKLYPSVSPQMIDIYRTEVLKQCDILLPNQTECEFLVGFKFSKEEDALRAIDVLHLDYGIHNVIITSLDLPDTPTGKLSVLASEILPGSKEARRVKITITKAKAHFSGTGDLFASLVLAYSVQMPNLDLGEVVTRTVNTIQQVIYETMGHKAKVNPNAAMDKLVELRLLQCGEFLRARTQPKSYTESSIWVSKLTLNNAIDEHIS